MKKATLLPLLIIICLTGTAQSVGIGTTAFTPDLSAQLEIQSTTKGVLIPRMNTTQMTAIPSPAQGLIVYNTERAAMYYYEGGAWKEIGLKEDNIDVWSRNGTNIYKNNTGFVGIGTPNPNSLFHVFRGTGAGGVLPFGSTATIENSGDVSLSLLSPDANTSSVHFGLNSNNFAGAISFNSAFNRKGLDFRTKAGVVNMVIDSFGRVGIGDLTPISKLDVKSTSNFNLANFNGGNQMFVGIYENDLYRGYWGSYSGAAEDVDFSTGAGNVTGKLHLGTQATPRFSITADGTSQVVGLNLMEFGAGVAGKEANAGKIGYNAFGKSALTFTGAGTTTTNRAVYFYAEGGNSTSGPIYAENPSTGQRTIAMRPTESGVDGASVWLYNAAGQVTIELDADFGDGDGRIITRELQINGGSDLAEHFSINKNNSTGIKPGMLVSIDEKNEGKLKITDAVNDKKIVGIISGANGIKAGMLMSQQGTIADGEYPVALAGRVYVLTNNEGGEINAGDFLTSSSEKGVAKKVTNFADTQGAIIGKAMGKANDKTGYVLVLVNLQ
jgi:hypothetical protein